MIFPPVNPPLSKIMDGDDKQHKAHRPSGKKKGKETQSKGYNEKVGRYFGLWHAQNPQPEIFYRHSPLIQVDERRSKLGATPNEIKLVCMSLWSTAFRRMSRLQSSSRLSVLPECVFLVAPQVNELTGLEQVGKTTLIRSLVRRYTKHTLSEVKGPITLVSGKKRRLTFIECNNDLNSMIDIGKIADLVLLMIDASFGFEMVCHIAKRP